jgi:methionyl-tRNA synthetase
MGTCPNCGVSGVHIYVCKQCGTEYCEICIADDCCPDCGSPDRSDPGRAWWKFTEG